MPKSAVSRIRQKVRAGQYDMSAHAMDEMAEDGLDIVDVESALLNGRLERTEKDDPRGTKYVVLGTATDDETKVGVVGRFTLRGHYLVITVYEAN